MKRLLKIEYHFNISEAEEALNSDEFLTPTDIYHRTLELEEALEEKAMERIFEELSKGWLAGDLAENVRFGKKLYPHEDEDDGYTYYGWWSSSIEKIE